MSTVCLGKIFFLNFPPVSLIRITVWLWRRCRGLIKDPVYLERQQRGRLWQEAGWDEKGKGGKMGRKKYIYIYERYMRDEGWGRGGLKGAKEMHSARLSVTARVNRESYFYPKPARRSGPLARLPCFSLPPVHDTRIILHAVMSLRRKRSQLSNTHHHFKPSHRWVALWGVHPPPAPPPLALINAQLFQTRRSSPVLRPPSFFFLLSFLHPRSSSPHHLFCLSSQHFLRLQTPTLPCLSSSGSVIPSSINYS